MYACTAGEQSEAEAKSKAVTVETKEVIVKNDGAVDHEYREWLEPEPPPVSILKSRSYVSGDESEAEQVRPTTDDPKQQGKKERRAGRKLVPVWRLVSRIFNNFNGKHIIHIYLCSFDLLICGTL